MAKEKKELKFNLEWCKGCGICAAFCPKGVLEINDEGKVKAAHPDKCISCGLCGFWCPDMVIELEDAS